MKKAVFFDRDGIINHDDAYVHEIAAFRWMDGIVDVLRQVKAAGYLVIIVTNQSGIARGMFSQPQFDSLTRWMVEVLAQQGIEVDGVYFCPHHPTAGDSALTRPCTCRKPQPGMLFEAAAEHQIDLSQSVMIGDSKRDIEAAIHAGCRQGIWLQPEPTETVEQQVNELSALATRYRGTKFDGTQIKGTQINTVKKLSTIPAIWKIDSGV